MKALALAVADLLRGLLCFPRPPGATEAEAIEARYGGRSGCC